MNKKLVIANWKSNPKTLKEAISLFSSFKNLKNTSSDIVVCAPLPFLGNIKSGLIKVGAQNVSINSEGPFTGEVTASMLKSVGVTYCIVGHSERRKMGETSLEVSLKAKKLLKEKITPIVCVGEKERGQNGEHFEEISSILLASIQNIPKNQLSGIIVAYEPLWAISTENKGVIDAATLQETIIFFKKILTDYAGKLIASKVTIIYGGSVDSKNALEILQNGGVSGFLVGKASLSIKTFGPILDAVKKV